MKVVLKVLRLLNKGLMTKLKCITALLKFITEILQGIIYVCRKQMSKVSPTVTSFFVTFTVVVSSIYFGCY